MSEETWIDNIPEEYRGTAAKYENPGELAKAYHELQLFRGKSLTIPGEDASAGEQDEFYTKVMEKVPGLVRKPAAEDAESQANFWKSMGRPESADDYPALEGMTPEQTAFMREAALGANLTAAQFKEFAGTFAEKQGTDLEISEAARKDELGVIYQELGVAKDQKLQAVKLLAQQLEMPESLQNFENPDVLRHMLKLVDKVGAEGSAMQQQIGNEASAVMTPSEAEQKISEIMNDPAYMDASDPRHKVLQKRVVELMAFAKPGASTTLATQRAGFGSVRATDTIF